MASVTEKPQSGPPPQVQGTEQQLVDQQIGRTRRSLKTVDFTVGLITLAIGVLLFLLATAILEHWVIPGGWSTLARSLLFGTLILGVVGYCWRTFLPLLGQSINPAYAAQAIEQSTPSLKNSLLNLLLLRNRRQQMSQQVYQAIEQQAAQGLSQVRLDTVVDRSAIVRLGYILLALTAVCALYRVLSPKDLITSAARVVMPWSSIATPSRVLISDIKPGDTKAARGEQLQVTAEVLGLEEDEPVHLLYSTADKQIVEQEIPMTASAGGAQFSCQVPGRIGSGSGIQQDFTYWIEAGDSRSPRYEVTVYARPTMVVNRLRYDFPAYTGFPSREVQHTGDISAVEGTKVTLFAQANKPIKTAHVDFEADGRRDLLMNSNDQQANVTFPLTLREDRRTPRYRSYALRYQATDDSQNEQPPKYQIEVQPDYSPEIQLLMPEEPMIEVALNKEVSFELEARDLDFALSKVLLLGQVGEEQVVNLALLEKHHTGRFVGKLQKTPEQLGLKVGDVLEYWGAAADNRQPEANLAFSAHRKLRVIDPWNPKNQDGQNNQEGEGDKEQNEGGESQEGEGGQEGQAGGGEQGNSSEGEEGESGEGDQGQESGESGENNQDQQLQGNNGESGEDQQQGGNDSQEGTGGQSKGENSENSESSEHGDSEQGDQTTEGGNGEAGGEQEKVSSEGDDDATAFEKMKEHFQEQEGENSGQSSEAQAGEGNEGDPQTKADDRAADGSPDSDQSDASGQSEPSEATSGEQSLDQQGTNQESQSSDEGATGEPATGEQENQGGAEEQEQDATSPDGQMSPEQGNAGAGDDKQDGQGSPNPTEGKKPKDKHGDSAEGAEQNKTEASSKSRDQSESDSEGGQGGDRSGGGKEGAGQQADADGQGGAGSHQAADDGAGQASETGEGETGNQPGDKQKATGETGESSEDQAGQGSEKTDQPGDQQGGESSQAGEGGQPGGEPNEGQPNESEAGNNSEQQANNQPPPNESSSKDAEGPSGDPSGTGGSSSAPPAGGELQPADEANLEYARKQTDLILDRLEDQLKKKEVDQGLLEKLGWSQDELRRFVDRWKNLKADAAKPNADDANQELNDALRSLGLRSNQRTGFQSQTTKDKLRNLQESFRGKIPLEYQEQVRSYLKGTATAQENP